MIARARDQSAKAPSHARHSNDAEVEVLVCGCNVRVDSRHADTYLRAARTVAIYTQVSLYLPRSFLPGLGGQSRKVKYLRTATVGNCTQSTPSVVAAAATATATARRHEARPVAHVSVWVHSLSGSPGSLAKRYLQVPPHTRSVGIPCSCPIHLQQPAPASLSPSHALHSLVAQHSIHSLTQQHFFT